MVPGGLTPGWGEACGSLLCEQGPRRVSSWSGRRERSELVRPGQARGRGYCAGGQPSWGVSLTQCKASWHLAALLPTGAGKGGEGASPGLGARFSNPQAYPQPGPSRKESCRRKGLSRRRGGTHRASGPSRAGGDRQDTRPLPATVTKCQESAEAAQPVCSVVTWSHHL